MNENQPLPEAAPLDVAGIKAEAIRMIRYRIRGEHSSNKVIRLCAAIEQQSARIATLEKLVREAMPTMTAAKSDIEAYTAYFKRPEPELDFVTRWLSAAREAVGEGAK